MVALTIILGAVIIAVVIGIQGDAIIAAIDRQTAVLEEVDLDEEPATG